LLPWLVRDGERLELAGQFVDVATGGAYRGRGLFQRLAETVLDVCRHAGVAFLYGFPNEAAYPIWTQKLGYEHVDDLVEFRSSVRTLWAERLATRVGAVSDPYERFTRRRLEARAASDPVLANSVVAEGFAGIERDSAFHRYKTGFAGSRVLSFEGGRAWLRLGGGMFLGDLEAQDESDLERTVEGVRRLALRLGVHRIVFQASASTRLASFLSTRFETAPGLPIIHRDIDSQIPVEKLRFTMGDLDNF
jgi:hypothetical protein